MGNFHVANEFRQYKSTWVTWYTPDGTPVYVLLRDPQGRERCIRHFVDETQFNAAHDVFVNYIGPKIDADVDSGSQLSDWEQVTKHHVPDEEKLKSTWMFMMSWDSRGGGGLIMYHLNPPGYENDEPFKGSERHRDWFEDDPNNPASADLQWPFQ